ncbi:MAG: RsmD family RNA methyltransferase [Planctomycetaceae bacterium]|jgi:16S rRNA (guanine(966)-N(2))-methyltransferase RsmD|nr:RsmD family RNA methyltransferase [Planctomycetaceae bacterium]
MKRKHHRGENTVFQIDNDNKGVFDSSKFHKKPVDERKTVPPVSPKRKRSTGSEPFEKDAVGLRVIGGKFRGSKLQYIGDNRVRPMKDRTREAVFNLLGPAVKGKYVIDLFGGTGALIIEAVSRGAVGGTVIEIHLPTARKLQENLQTLNLTGVCELKKIDAFFWIKQQNHYPSSVADYPLLVFCSPPYDFFVSRKEEMFELIIQMYRRVPHGSVFVIESDGRFDIAELPLDLSNVRVRDYPPAKVAILEK